MKDSEKAKVIEETFGKRPQLKPFVRDKEEEETENGGF